jgi:7,8-dihydro-6-hydroxymethylpterin dimethyltransferase
MKSAVHYEISSTVPTLSNLSWNLLQYVNSKIPAGDLRRPAWAPGRLLKSDERSMPPLGVPRKTISICPKCNQERVSEALCRERPLSEFADDPGLIEAQILEEAGRVLMRKVCDRHGPFEDMLSSDVEFFRRMERLYPGRDFACIEDDDIHKQGPLSIRYGRGVYLVVDLTNRCDMKCTPCFMDANHVNYVHELDLEQVKAIFRRALSFRPRREINVLFSGGEPTLYPHFLDAVRYAYSLGFKRLHVATNGIRFAQERDFAQQAGQAGLHGVFLQFDGTTPEKNAHRGVANLLDVKIAAIENIAKAGMLTTLQSTVINGVNDDAVGDIVEFAVKNIDKIRNVVFQPISFAGRDANVDDEDRYRRRYTTAQLASDLQTQLSPDWQPLRDWFPIAAWSAISRVLELMQPESAEWGPVSPETHPNWMVASSLIVNRKTKAWAPITSFFDFERFMADAQLIRDSARGRMGTAVQVRLAALRNFDLRKAPRGFGLNDMSALTRECFSRMEAYTQSERSEWALLNVFGMWFQDLFNYDVHAAQSSGTPVATEEGEISFCAYNSANWRKVVEQAHRTASLAEWIRQYGRHTIYANGKSVPLGTSTAASVHSADSASVGESSVFVK